MCLSPSFQERSESLINTFKEILRCWLQHLIFCHSDHSSTCSTEPGSQASVNIPDSLNIFHIPSLTDYLIYVHTVRTRPSVRHLFTFVSTWSFLKLQVRWRSVHCQCEGRVVLFQSKCLPWSVQAAGSQGYTADLNREAQRPACISIRIAPTNNHRSVPKCSWFMSSLSKLNFVNLALMWPCWLFQFHVSTLSLGLDSEAWIWGAVLLGALVSVGFKMLIMDLWWP